MFCSKCGQQIADNAVFCQNCGTQVAQQAQGNAQQAGAPQTQQYNANTQQTGAPQAQQYNANTQQAGAPQGQQYNANTQQGTQSVVDNILNTADHTNEYSQAEIKNGKVMSILSYIGILVLIPLFAEKNNRYVRFHVNQGFTLVVIELAIAVVGIVLNFIPIFGIVIRALLSLATLILMILGIVNAATGKAKELPIIGSIKLVN